VRANRAGLMLVVCALSLVLSRADALAKGTLWSATLYAGPASNDFASHIVSGKFRVQGAMVGVALDRNILYLGSGFKVVAEGQVTHYFLDQPTTTINLGLGIKYAGTAISPTMPLSVAFYMGPSYAIDPPLYTTSSGITRHRFLNFLSVEVAVGLPRAPGWDIVFREYHRSGMYGLYAKDVDEGSMLGVGIRRRF
jgi:hypothetical protein